MELEDVPQQRVKNWCKHLVIYQENVSLVGQMVDLPIGAKRIGCRFHHGYSGMTIKDTASIFIEGNCVDCPHHVLVSSDNYGEGVISKIQERAKRKNEVGNANQLLKGLIPINPKAVLESDIESDATARELAGLLIIEEHKCEAVDKLLQGTKHKPQIISEKLAAVLIGAVLDQQVGGGVLEILRLAGQYNQNIVSIAIKGANIALDEGRNVDSACMLIAEGLKQGQIKLTPTLVSSAVSWLSSPVDPFPSPRIRGRKKHRDGVEEALKVFISQDQSLVEGTVISLLGSDQPHLVATACAAVQVLHQSLPDFSFERYLEPLFGALSWEREDEDLYVDASICQTCAKIMVSEPLVISKEILAAIIKASEELQEALLHVFIRDEALAFAEVWIEPLLNLLANDRLAEQTKFKVSEMLSIISKDRPDVIYAHITGLFGVLAIVCDLEDKRHKLVREEERDEISFIEYQSNISALSGTARNLREIIENVGNTDAERTLSEIESLISRTSSKIAASFKRELILLLGDFGHRHPELSSKIIPIIFPHLVDNESYMVRGAAAEAFSEIAMRDGTYLPENVVLVLAALLSDEYLYPVRVATEAFEWIQVKDFQTAGKVVNALVGIYFVYKQDQSQGHLIEKASVALVNVANSHTQFLPYAAQVAADLANNPYFYSAKDGLRSLRRLASQHKEYQSIYLLSLLDHYSRYDLEITSSRANYHSGKSDSEFEKLYSVSPEVIRSEITKLMTVAHGQKEPYNLIHFASLLIYVGIFEEAAQLLRSYVTLLPEEERYAWDRSTHTALALLLDAETALKDSHLSKAKESMEKALEELGSRANPKRNLPFGLEQSIPKEKVRPYFYITWLQIRLLWLNLSDDPAEAGQALEKVVQQIKELKLEANDQRVLDFHEELAIAAKFLSEWYQCVLNGDSEQVVKREAIKGHLSEALKGLQTNDSELLKTRIKDHLIKVDSLSATNGMTGLLQELILDPMPIPQYDLPIPEHWHSPIKRNNLEISSEEKHLHSHANVAFAKVLIDGQEIPKIVTIVAGRIHDIKIVIELSRVNTCKQELRLAPLSVLPEQEYIFPRQSVPLIDGENTYEIKGHLKFNNAQSELSEPIDTRIQVFLVKPDGSNESCTVFGQSHLKFKIRDEARLLAHGKAEASAVDKVFKNLDSIVSDFKTSPYPEEREIITCLINYAGYQLKDPSFTNAEIDEKEFQRDLTRYLCIKIGRNDVFREIKSGRGFLDVLALGIPVELKVFRGYEKLEHFAGTSLPQVTQYTISQERSVGILCILDTSDRTTATPNLIDDVMIRKGETEMGIDPSPEGVIGVVTIIIRGASRSASKLR